MKPDPKLKDFIVLVGLPGSGKSAYALATFPNHVLISVDLVVASMAEVVKKKFNEVFNDVAEPAKQITDAQIQLATFVGEDIVVDANHLTVEARQHPLSLMRKPETYWKVAMVFDTPEELLNLRLSKRGDSGTMIPKSVRRRLAASYVPVGDLEGFDEIITIAV